MLFKFKQKKLVLDCFTTRKSVYDYSPVDYSRKFIPDWWKELPKTVEIPGQLLEYSTMKYCNGFIDQFKEGLIIPMWCDLMVEVGPINEARNKFRSMFSDGVSSLTSHPEFQRGRYLPETHYQHVKINSPWYFRCDKEVKWQMLPNPYLSNKLDNYTILPGVVDYKHQGHTNINMFFKRTEKYEKYKFNFGTPMIQINPLSELKLEIRRHLIDDKEYENLLSYENKLFFVGALRNFKKIKEQSGTKKCPFHG